MDPGPYEPIAEVYDLWCAEVVEDVDFYVDACAGAAGTVVELGAGTGRIAIPVVEAGHRVIAVDRSPAMLAQLRARAESAGVGDRIETVVGTLEALPPLAATDCVLAPFRTLLHLPNDAARVAFLRAVRELLEPGGRFVFDVFEPTRQDIRQTHGRWLQRESGVRERARWNATTHALDLAVRHRGRETEMRLHWVPGRRWRDLAAAADLVVAAAYSGFDGEPFDGRPGDSAWVLERPR